MNPLGPASSSNQKGNPGEEDPGNPLDRKVAEVSSRGIESLKEEATGSVKALIGQERYLVEEAKHLALQNGKIVSEQISVLGITHQPSLIEIAKIAAAQNGRAVSRYIQNYGIVDKDGLKEIAKIAAAQSGRGVCQHLDNYGISDDPHAVAEILQVAVLHFGLDAVHNVETYCKSTFLSLSPEDRNKIVLSAFGFSLFKKEALNKFYPMIGEYLLGSGDLVGIGTSAKELFKECWEKQKEQMFNGVDFHAVLDKALKYRGTELSSFLLGVFVQEGGNSLYQDRYRQLVTRKEVVPRLLPSVILAKWLAQAPPSFDSAPLLDFFSKHHRTLKDQTGPLLSALLTAEKSLDLLEGVSKERKLEVLIKICEQSDVGDIVKSLRLITYFSIRKDVGRIEALPLKEPKNELKKAFEEVLHETLEDIPLVTKEAISRYQETLGNTRVPFAFPIYQTTLNRQGRRVQDMLDRFARSVILGTFQERRFELEDNPHLQRVQEVAPETFEKWKNLSWEEDAQALAPTEKLVFTQNWEDLFLSGTEVIGSCQRVDASASDSKCLLAYCLDGKNSMVAVKDESGKILARAMVRLLWDPVEEKPALFLDTTYPEVCPANRKNALVEAAKKCAEEIGCPLFQSSFSESGKNLVSLGSCCPYEYADTGGGVTRGMFSVCVQKVE